MSIMVIELDTSKSSFRPKWIHSYNDLYFKPDAFKAGNDDN